MNKHKNHLICLLSVTILFISTQPLFSQSGAQATPSKRKVPVIELKGNGYQRGLYHGKVLKKEIAEVFGKWKEDIASSAKQNADSAILQFYSSTNFVPAIKKWTPGIYDEIKGISDGSGQSFTDVFCFQLVDELWVYIDKLQNQINHHCSAIGVAATASNPANIAQNNDLETFRNGFQILLHIPSNNNEPEQYILSCAGLIALLGINSEGIGVCLNTLMELEASTDGLPVACVVRGILTKQTRESALYFLQTVKHASGQNYILGAVDSVYDFEASASKVVRFLPDAGNYSVVYHTNHAFANDDIKPWHKESHQRQLTGNSADDNSVIRFASLKSRLNLSQSGISEDVIKQTLKSKDDRKNQVCRSINNEFSGFTFSSVVLTLGKSPNIQLTYGPPDQAEYILHSFSEK